MISRPLGSIFLSFLRPLLVLVLFWGGSLPVATVGSAQDCVGKRCAPLEICKAVDGGIIADRTSAGAPIYYGLTVATQTTYDFVVGDQPVSILGAATPPLANCVLAGQYDVNSRVDVHEVLGRGFGVSAITATPENALHKRDVVDDLVSVKIAKDGTMVTYTNQHICVTNSTNGLTVGGYCQEAAGGLASIGLLHAVNGQVSISPFVAGTTDPVTFSATKVDELALMTVELVATSTSGVTAVLLILF